MSEDDEHLARCSAALLGFFVPPEVEKMMGVVEEQQQEQQEEQQEEFQRLSKEVWPVRKRAKRDHNSKPEKGLLSILDSDSFFSQVGVMEEEKREALLCVSGGSGSGNNRRVANCSSLNSRLGGCGSVAPLVRHQQGFRFTDEAPQ